jgi:crotonobetainyl-CoA:carnitine CoA-transferase CaiB-like acyl-CoA transferase
VSGQADTAIPERGPGADLLAGVTVLDFTRVLAGPYCTRLLADLGARVVKVERPGRGDDIRLAPLQLEAGRDDQSTYFVRVNAGKRSVAIDLAHPEARGIVLDLARQADVVVENFLPGVMVRLGYDYRALAAVKPDLVYCSISGYGQTGPWRDRPAFAHVIGAVSGLMALERQGEAEPRVAYLQAADVLAATHAFGAIVAALLRRARTGRGAYLDVSMLEALVAADDISYPSVLNGGPATTGPRPGMVVHRIGERHLAMQIVGSRELWPRVVEMLGRPELGRDPRFATPVARREHWGELRPYLVEWLDRFESVEAALDALAAARIPCAPVLDPAEVVTHPQLLARGAFPAVAHPARGEVRVTASPFQVDGSAVRPGGPAPYEPGEDTEAVLRDVLGYPAARIAELARLGAIGIP